MITSLLDIRDTLVRDRHNNLYQFGVGQLCHRLCNAYKLFMNNLVKDTHRSTRLFEFVVLRPIWVQPCVLRWVISLFQFLIKWRQILCHVCFSYWVINYCLHILFLEEKVKTITIKQERKIRLSKQDLHMDKMSKKSFTVKNRNNKRAYTKIKDEVTTDQNGIIKVGRWEVLNNKRRDKKILPLFLF